jgi:hypothetical protein
MGLILLITYRSIAIEQIIKKSAQTYWIICTLSIVAMILFKDTNTSIRFPSLLQYLFPSVIEISQNLTDNISLNIFNLDWSEYGLGIRPSIMAPYPTAYAATLFALFILSMPRNKINYVNLFVKSLFFIYFALYASATRSILLSSGIYLGLFVIFLFSRKDKKQKNRKTYFLILTASAVFLILCYILFFSNVINEILSLREGSSNLRRMIYITSIKEVIEQNIFLGIGYKERIENLFAIPLGSHSTFIGVFYKTGILGSFFFILFTYQLLKFSAEAISKSEDNFYLAQAGCGILSFLPYLFFEDIDATPFLFFLFFILISVCRKELHREKLKIDAQ